MGVLRVQTVERHPSAANKVRVTFSEAVDANAGVASCYTITGGLTVSTAVRDATSGNRQADLTLSGNLLMGTEYTVTVNTIADIASSTPIISPNEQGKFKAGTADIRLNGVVENGGLLMKTPRLLLGDRPLGYNVQAIVFFYLYNVIPQSGKVVRAEFSRITRHADLTLMQDALNPHNYYIPGREVLSVAFVNDTNGHTSVDLTLDKEMMIGTVYTLRAQGTLTNASEAIDTPNGLDVLNFVGIGDRPSFTTVTAGEQRVDVVFNESLDPTTLLPAAFTIAPNGGTGSAVSVSSIAIVSGTQARLTLNKRMTNGQPYRITMATTVKDLAGNTALGSPPTTFDFTGFAVPANILNIAFLDATHVRVLFDVDVTNDAALQNVASYTGSNGLKVLAVTIEGTRSVLLTTSELQHGISYTLTV